MSAGNATGAEAYAAAGGGGGAMLGSQGHVVAVMGNAYQRLEDWLARRWGSSVYLLYSYTRTNTDSAYQRLEDWLARRSCSSVYLLYSYTRTNNGNAYQRLEDWLARRSIRSLPAVLVQKYQY